MSLFFTDSAMNILILKDSLGADPAPDALDNLAEAEFVARELRLRHAVAVADFRGDLPRDAADIRAAAPDAVFNLVESVAGRDALAPAAALLLEALGIPFTGNSARANLLSADKLAAKAALRAAGVAVPETEFRPGAEFLLKSRAEHASAGLDASCVVRPDSAAALEKLVAEKSAAAGRPWLAERFIAGREFNAAILGDAVLPPAEIVFTERFSGPRILTYASKWDEDSAACRESVRRFVEDAGLAARITAAARRCAAACGLSGYARVDFRMDAAGTLYAIDVNTNPCIAPDAGFVAMARRAGLSDLETLERIIRYAYVP